MTNKKFVVVLNKSYELKNLVSAIGHVTVGLTSCLSVEDLSLVKYEDADGIEYPGISDWPFIILRATSGQMKTARDKLLEAGLPTVIYTDTMFTGGSEVQQSKTRQKKSEEIEFVAISTFGTADKVDSICKKFSLWR